MDLGPAVERLMDIKVQEKGMIIIIYWMTMKMLNFICWIFHRNIFHIGGCRWIVQNIPKLNGILRLVNLTFSLSLYFLLSFHCLFDSFNIFIIQDPYEWTMSDIFFFELFAVCHFLLFIPWAALSITDECVPFKIVMTIKTRKEAKELWLMWMRMKLI